VVLRLYTAVVLECCEAVGRRAWTHANPKLCGRARAVAVRASLTPCPHGTALTRGVMCTRDGAQGDKEGRALAHQNDVDMEVANARATACIGGMRGAD
jgi:hypothetical protein